MKRFGVFAVLLAAQIAATPVLAGIVDSPLPVLEAGKTTYHLYSVPGVVDGWPGLATYFYCASTDKVPVRVGVECFISAGGLPWNDAVATSSSLTPGRTEAFVTHVRPNMSANVDLGCGLMAVGSARILATSKKVICTAFVADTVNTPPTTTWQLTIVKKTKQKGD